MGQRSHCRRLQRPSQALSVLATLAHHTELRFECSLEYRKVSGVIGMDVDINLQPDIDT